MPVEFLYVIGVFLKIEFLRNLFMQIQEQVQNLEEFIYAIKHTVLHYILLSCL